jgi:hypothetical protein
MPIHHKQTPQAGGAQTIRGTRIGRQAAPANATQLHFEGMMTQQQQQQQRRPRASNSNGSGSMCLLLLLLGLASTLAPTATAAAATPFSFLTIGDWVRVGCVT